MTHGYPKFTEFVGAATWKFLCDCADILAFTGELFAAACEAVRHPKKIRWRETLYYMDMCGSDAVPITLMICFLMGLILGFQGAVQMHKYGGDVYLAPLVGASIVKELGPLMVAIIATGRAGSSFAAEIGTMKVSEEIDAMMTMGFVPSRFLVIPKMIAMILVLPMLTAMGDAVGIIGGMLVANIKLGIPFEAYYNMTLWGVKPFYFFEGLTKSAVYAFIIASIGCMRGFEARTDAMGVGRAATSAVVTSIFLIAVADALLAFIFSSINES